MALNCPRCNPIKLEEIELGDIPVDRCPRCGGLWFDNSEVTALTGRGPELSGFESIVPPATFIETTMQCPRCANVDLRKLDVTGKNRTQTIYRCISCLGTWIDRGELRETEDTTVLNALKAYFSDIQTGKEVR